MNLTARMKQWLVTNCNVKANASDDEFRKALGEALAKGSLSIEKFNELTTTKEAEEANAFHALMEKMSNSLEELNKSVKAKANTDEEEGEPKSKKKPIRDDYDSEEAYKRAMDEYAGEEEEEEEKKKKKKEEESDEEESDTSSKSTPVGGQKGGGRMPSKLEKMILGMGGNPIEPGEKSFSIRVKEAADQYSSTTKAAIFPSMNKAGRPHPLAGQPMRDYSSPGKSRVINEPSELSMAISGAFAQFEVDRIRKNSRTLAFMSLPQHSKELLCYALENEKWGGCGPQNSDDRFSDINDRKLTELEQKALIDDSVSGGVEAAPVVFDDQVIQTPLLHGELFPLVTSIPLDRGRRVEAVETGTATATWGGVDDQAIDLFDTVSYITPFDTTIFRWEGAIRIGLDFLSDTPIDFSQHVTAQYGERLLEMLDNAIATGNGTTQPEGVMVKTGATSINFGGVTTIGNYESLRFGVAKAEHRANMVASAVFCGTEVSYQRARSIPVGAADARRLGGFSTTVGGVTNYSDYSWMGYPYKINESMSNNQIFYAIMARYRMYRRRGLTLRSSTEGDSLIRRNEMLLTATARYGGQVERGAVVARTTTAPA